METLSQTVRECMEKICLTLHLGYANWDNLVERIERRERDQRPDFGDEQVWTFLLSAAYAVAGRSGATCLAQLLVENKNFEPVNKIWFECLPIPPRLKEGNTHLDLALGAISRRVGSQSGIEYAPQIGDAICFCEFKWYSDISIDVFYERHRNQLARVIENALCFQSEKYLPKQVHVTLVTPARFLDQKIKSRLYQYKFSEYRDSTETLLDELDACSLAKRDFGNFSYPEIASRTQCLNLHWVSFQSLAMNAPESPLKEAVVEFVSRFDGTETS